MENQCPNSVLRVPPSPFLKKLGYGAGVSVLEMSRSPRVGVARSPWAIKRVLGKYNANLYGRRLLAEADLLRKMDHPNVVGFRSMAETGDGGKALAMEKCEACLGELISERREGGLAPYTPVKIFRVAEDVGAALRYLHEDVLLLHGDIKSFNVLINGDFEICKLCDFGVSVPLNRDGTLAVSDRVFVGTGCWNAPEVVNSDGPITSKSDIFSFGVTLWEMIALEIPHSELCLEDSTEMDDSAYDPTEFYGTRPLIPDIDPIEYEDVLSLFHCMTEKDPAARPTAEHVNLFSKSRQTKQT